VVLVVSKENRRLFFPFEIILNNVWLCINTRNIAKCTWEENVVFDVNVEIMAISENCKVLVYVYFVSEVCIAQP
jgi:hypothetical protein